MDNFNSNDWADLSPSFTRQVYLLLVPNGLDKMRFNEFYLLLGIFIKKNHNMALVNCPECKTEISDP